MASLNIRIKSIIRLAGLALLLLTGIPVAAQNKFVVTIGPEKITKEEFTANYLKNNTNVLDKKDIKTPGEYLDLYIKFKLKVMEAEALGYDTIRSFRDELEGYRKEMARPYLTDISFNEEMVKTAYYRMKNERSASHILIRATPEASPSDTLTAWKKINDIRKKILEGADFGEMAAKYSEDPSAVQNKGLLGYFTAFQMVFPFEDMAFRTPVGQVSEVVRTRFGYHIIKVHDERPVSGEIKVAHIMKIFPPQATDEIIQKTKLQADSIWQKANSGADFGELARKYSDDKQSSPDGGVLNWFSSGNMVASFAEAAFALKNDGDISPVIRTPFGWHIIKRLERRPVQPFEKLRPVIESKIKQNPLISKHSDEAFDRKLRAEYQLKINESVWEKLPAIISDSVQWRKAKNNRETRKELLISFAGQTVTAGDFFSFLDKQKFAPAQGLEAAQLQEQLNKFIHQNLLAYEDAHLETKYPEFASLYREYHDGILLFNISKDKIWDAASTDTARLTDYYNHTSKRYYWNDRFKGWIIKAVNQEIRVNAERYLNENEVSKNDLLNIFNTPNDQKIQVTDVTAEKGTNPVVDYFIWNGSKPAGFDETTTFVHGKIVQNEVKELKDGWGLYSSDLQETLEKEWVNSLYKKYPVKINSKVLSQIESLK